MNAVIKVVAYDAHGGVIRAWGARAYWDGQLPQHYRATLQNHHWAWSNAAGRTVRVQTTRDGAGGETVEQWGARLRAVAVDVYAESSDDVRAENDPLLSTARDGSAPGEGTDRDNSHANSPAEGHLTTAGGGYAHSGTFALPSGASASDSGGKGSGAALRGPPSAESGSAASGTAIAQSMSADGEALDRWLDDALGDEEIEAEGDNDAFGNGGKGYAGGAPTGRTGDDTSTWGAGPGGERARHDGDGEGSRSHSAPIGSRNGSWGGQAEGAPDGMAGGEGLEGDRGIPSGMGAWGGKIPVPESLRAGVEITIVLLSADVTGDISGLGAGLFRRGLRRGLRGPISMVRRMVAREARAAARMELRAALRSLRRKPAFLAMTESERQAAVKIAYWERQRQFFRGYLDAARTEQKAARAALRNAKHGERSALRLRESAATEGERVALAEPVAGRLPVNHAYAGGEFPRELLPPKFRSQGVRIKETGYPDFSPFAAPLRNGKNEVAIVFSGSYAEDVKLANAAAGLEHTPRGFTWHHVEDGKTMMLVPDNLHRAVNHAGGVAAYKHAHGVGYHD